jgi:hypothetical protein
VPLFSSKKKIKGVSFIFFPEGRWRCQSMPPLSVFKIVPLVVISQPIVSLMKKRALMSKVSSEGPCNLRQVLPPL